MSKQLGPSNHPLEVFRRRIIALQGEGYNDEFLKCFRNALEKLKEHDAIATQLAAAERDAALMKRRVDGLLEELRTGEQLMHRITGNAMLARPPIEFNDLEMANRWRMRVKLLHESGRLVLAAPDAAMQPQAGVEAIRQLRAQLAAAERDAARYRYLRDDGYGITIDVLEYDDDGGEDWVSGHSPADLDAAIDRFRQPDNGGIPSP